jgi:GT2 family glycosyltransferase
VNPASIGIVIVNWNTREDVLAGLRSLRDQAQAGLDDTVVVDNGSTDGSAVAIRAEFPAVQVIEAGRNLGFAEGCNRGIAATRSDWVFLFNSDAVAEAGCVAELRRVAASAPPEVGMLQPLLVFTARPSHANSSGIVVFRDGHARDRHFADPVEAAISAGDPFCPTAGAALYRRSMLERVRIAGGYLDRDFFMYFEDVDLGWRGRLAGYRAAFVPTARVRHRFQGSSKRRGVSFAETQCRVNRIATLLRNASYWFILRTLRVTWRDVVWVLRAAGPAPLVALAKRIPATLRDRVRMGRLRRVGRRALERTWLTSAARPPPQLDLSTGMDEAAGS